jgi:predicted transcriptional regulator
MIALKASNLKPSLVVFQTSQPLDDLARRISELEGIPVATTKQSTECILERLKKRFKE